MDALTILESGLDTIASMGPVFVARIDQLTALAAHIENSVDAMINTAAIGA